MTVYLSEEGSRDEPEWVWDAELVLHDLALGDAGVRVVPLVRAEPGHHEEGERHQHVGRKNVPSEQGKGMWDVWSDEIWEYSLKTSGVLLFNGKHNVLW